MKILEYRQLLILLKNDTRGVIAVIAAVVLIPTMILAIGAGIDYSTILKTQYIMQTSLDAALLSSKILAEDVTEEEMIQAVQTNFKLNLNKQILKHNPQVSVTTSSDSVTAQAYVHRPLMAYQILGMKTTKIAVSSSISLLDIKTEPNRGDIVLVVDRWFYGIERPHNIRKELQAFTDIAMDYGNNTVEDIQIGTVFYSMTVRLPSYVDRNTSWVDTDALSPIHSASFSSDINRFDLFDKVDVKWNGCVEVRPQPYDVHDYDPTFAEMTPEERRMGTSRDARFFVPWFEPDQMDIDTNRTGFDYTHYTAWTTYVQDYTADETNSAFDFKLPKNLQDRADSISANDKLWFMHQASAKKYSMNDRIMKSLQPFQGPTGICNYKSQIPMTVLNHDYDTVQKDIWKYAFHVTNPNILQGFNWGWRILSAGEPFTSTPDPDVPKTMFVLTSGYNFNATSGSQTLTPNLGEHTPFGIPYENRLDVSGDIFKMSFEDLRDARNERMDKLLLQACEHAKADGIEIYMITLKPYDNHKAPEDRKEIMQKCASSEEHYYHINIEEFSIIFGEMYAREKSKPKRLVR